MASTLRSVCSLWHLRWQPAEKGREGEGGGRDGGREGGRGEVMFSSVTDQITYAGTRRNTLLSS